MYTIVLLIPWMCTQCSLPARQIHVKIKIMQHKNRLE